MQNRGGSSAGAYWNRAILKHWQRVGRKLDANALLLHPMCHASWFCHLAQGWRVIEHYSGEAIRVPGPLCMLPFECWSARTIVVGSQQLERAMQRDDVHFLSLPRTFGLSVAVTGLLQKDLEARHGALRSTLSGRLHCPVRHSSAPSLPVQPTPASAAVNAQGRVAADRMVIFQVGGGVSTDRRIARFLRHWRFHGPGLGPHPVHLLMDWHLVALHKGQPVPRGVVCVYPAYPSSGWKRGKLIRHLRWSVYALREGGKKILYAAIPAQAR